MPQRTDSFELGRLGLTSGEGRRLDLHASIAAFDYGGQGYEVDAREVSQPGGGEELQSPYVEEEGAELDLEAWARDALSLALPAQLTCRDDCAGLCPQCGANLNEDPEHRHESAPDQRWAKLSEIKFD